MPHLLVTPSPPSCYQPGLVLGSCHTSSPRLPPSIWPRVGNYYVSATSQGRPVSHMRMCGCGHVWVSGLTCQSYILLLRTTFAGIRPVRIRKPRHPDRSTNNTKKIRSQENVFGLRIIRINEVRINSTQVKVNSTDSTRLDPTPVGVQTIRPMTQTARTIRTVVTVNTDRGYGPVRYLCA